MNTRILVQETPENTPAFEVTNYAVAELWKHGWEPPAAQAYDIPTPDGGHLVIPKRWRQHTATPTQDQLETIILTRLAARLDLVGITSADTGCAVVKACGDAAEAIHDLLGAQ